MNISNSINSVIGLAGVLALAMSASLAFAEVKEVMKIKVKTDDGIAETVKIENLAVGDTEVFLTESGREVLVSRFDDSLKLEVDGQVIDVQMPKVHAVAGSHSGERHIRMVHEGDKRHKLEAENIWVTEDDEVIVSNGATKRIVIHRSGEGDADFDGEVSCEVEITVDGEAGEGEMDDIADLCGTPPGDGENVMIIKKKIVIEDDGSDD